MVCLFVGLSGCATLKRNPISDDVVMARQMSLRGLDAIQQGNWQAAEAHFADAVRTNPIDERAHVQYAELLWRRGLREDAVKHLEYSVKLSGDDPTLVVRLGEMYLARGDADLAWQQTERALKTNRQLACVWSLRGDIHRQAGRLNEALADYHRSLSYEGHCPHVQLALADIYRQQNRPRRALSTLEALAQHYPPDKLPQELLLEQGLALKALGRFDSAAIWLAEAARRSEPSAELLFHLAETQLQAGDPTNARMAVVAALNHEPGHAPSQRLKSELDQRQQRLTAAVERY